MQAMSTLGQNITDDIRGSIPTATQQFIPGTSSLNTGQAPAYGQSLSGIQEKSPALGAQQQPLQGQQFLPQQGFQQPLQQNLPAQQQFSNLQGQQMGYQQGQQQFPMQQQGQMLPQQGFLGQQGLQQGQQFLPQQSQQFLPQQGFQQPLQQNLPAQQQFSNLQGQQFLPQQGIQGQQQGVQQGQQFLPQQGLQQGIMQQTTLQEQLLPATQFQVAPVIFEHKESAPVIHERIRREEVEEVLPVIHREREKTEIHRITQPVHTSSVLNCITEEATLPAKYSEMRTPSMLPPASVLPRREELAASKMRIEKAPVVIETERKKIIEEVTPVVYKEIVEPHVTRLTQPIYEKIVEGDVYVTEIRAAQVIAPTVTTTQFVQQNVPVQIPVVQQLPIFTKNVEVAETYVKEGVPITTTASRGLFGRKAVC